MFHLYFVSHEMFLSTLQLHAQELMAQALLLTVTLSTSSAWVVWSVARRSYQPSAVIFFFPSTMAAARYWIREWDEAKITHSATSTFIGLSVFTGFLLTFNWVQRYSMGYCHATPKPNSRQMLITILQWWHCLFRDTVLAESNHKAIVSLVVFFGTQAVKVSGVLMDVWQSFPSGQWCCCCCLRTWWRSPRGTLQPHAWGTASREVS